MASPAPPGSAATAANGRPRKPPGFFENARRNKRSYIQFAAMTGVLLLSIKSLGLKHHIFELEKDNLALKEEQDALTKRMNNIKRDLLHEASLEPTGRFASRLRRLFGDDQ